MEDVHYGFVSLLQDREHIKICHMIFSHLLRMFHFPETLCTAFTIKEYLKIVTTLQAYFQKTCSKQHYYHGHRPDSHFNSIRLFSYILTAYWTTTEKTVLLKTTYSQFSYGILLIKVQSRSIYLYMHRKN